VPADLPPLSQEQRRATELAARGGDGSVVARAGSGKTHTLRAVALRTAPRPTLLLAFNRAIAREAARRFPGHVSVATLHALAFRAVVAGDGRMRRKFAAGGGAVPYPAWLELAGLDPGDPGRHAHLAALRGLLRTFCASADAEPAPDHLPAATRERLRATLGAERAGERERWLAVRARRAWARMADPDDPAPIDHDGYLKLFERRRGPLPTELLLVDEAQDLAPAMLAIVDRQDASRLLVGDPAQRIYGWRGAVDAMAASGYPEVRLTRSFRFGAEIAASARRVVRVLAPGAALEGAGPPGGVLDGPWPDGRPRTVLCRSNAGVVEAASTLGEHGVHVVGGLDATLTLLRAAHRMWRDRGRRVGVRSACERAAVVPPELAGLDDWAALVEAAEASGGPLRTLQRLIDEHGDDVPRLCTALERAQREREGDAPLVLSTVHRAKGREWDRVELWRDLPRVPADAGALASAPDPEAARAEVNLLYVAVTRARRELGVGRLREDVRALLLGADR
jgi:hypothetical protein